MKATEIKGLIKEQFDDTGAKSILIDGPWGCGKTHAIMEYIEENTKNKARKKNEKRKKIIYVSLYGMQSIDDIKQELFNKSGKLAKILNVTKKITIFRSENKAVQGSLNGLKFTLEIAEEYVKKQIGKHRIIIFDDFDRVSDKISYRDLLGLFNFLMLNGSRIICVANIESLEKEKDKDKLDEFQKFREKIFDEYKLIDEVDDNVFMNIFKGFDYNKLRDIFVHFDKNYRMAKMTYNFYKKVKEQLNNSNSTLDDYQIICYCLFTVKSVIFINKQITIDREAIEKKFLEDLIKRYDESTAYGIYNFLYNRVCESIVSKPSQPMIEAFITAFKNRKFSTLLDFLLDCKPLHISNIA